MMAMKTPSLPPHPKKKKEKKKSTCINAASNRRRTADHHYFSSAESFSCARRPHRIFTILARWQVAQNATSPTKMDETRARWSRAGGAMDLVAGVKRVGVVIRAFRQDGRRC